MAAAIVPPSASGYENHLPAIEACAVRGLLVSTRSLNWPAPGSGATSLSTWARECSSALAGARAGAATIKLSAVRKRAKRDRVELSLPPYGRREGPEALAGCNPIDQVGGMLGPRPLPKPHGSAFESRTQLLLAQQAVAGPGQLGRLV